MRLPYVLNHELAEDLGSGRRRPEWMWVALRGERVVARIAWWSRDGGAPLLLDFFDLDDTLPEPERGEVGLRLLETASAAVLPAAWPASRVRAVRPARLARGPGGP